MNSEPLVSVIIPVYNVEDYLRTCLDSVLNQTYKNLEIIIVNDGSTDASRSICEEYTKKDARCTLVNKANGGLSSAKNTGLEKVHGEWLTFVDSDDYVAPNYIQYMHGVSRRENAELVICQFQKVSNHSAQIKNNPEKIKIMTPEQSIEMLLYKKGIYPSSWAKLYKTRLYESIRFPEHTNYEDLAVICQLMDQARSIAISNQKIYYYLDRKNSIMNDEFSKKKMQRIEVAKSVKSYIEQYHPALYNAVCCRCFLAGLQALREIPQNKKYSNEVEGAWSVIKEYRRDVVLDHDAKTSIRLMAVSSFLGKNFLHILGRVHVFIDKG